MKQSLITGLVLLVCAAFTGQATAQELEEGAYRTALQYFKTSADPGTTFRLAKSSDRSEQMFAVAAARALRIPVTAKEAVISCPSDPAPMSECSLPEPNSVLVEFVDVGLEDGQWTQIRVMLHKQESPDGGIHGELWHLTLKQDPAGRWTVENAELALIS